MKTQSNGVFPLVAAYIILACNLSLAQPAQADSFSITGSLTTGRYYNQTATLLPNGSVLVVGGKDSSGNVLASAELYDPITKQWSGTQSMSTPRQGHTATLLSDGLVLVAGGGDNNGNILSSAEMYDPIAKTWSPTGSMATPRGGHTATLLPNGLVLVAAGGNHGVLASAELYNPITQTWVPTNSMHTARTLHTATLLASGQVLVTGGLALSGELTSANCMTRQPERG
jgi:WD40 repeat protein